VEHTPQNPPTFESSEMLGGGDPRIWGAELKVELINRSDFQGFGDKSSVCNHQMLEAARRQRTGQAPATYRHSGSGFFLYLKSTDLAK
jgi:hypothetical protein